LISKRLKVIPFVFVLISTLSAMLAGCGVFRPERAAPAEGQAPLFQAPAFQPTLPPAAPTADAANPPLTNAADCVNSFSWLNDITIPDGTQVVPGFQLDKQWQVKNTGTCNWNETYSLRLTAGIEMGAPSPQALVPARSGAEAVVRLQFTAPSEPGRYRSAWQAHTPDGKPFGDPIFIEIVVTTP
jgi:hypothetical protein